MERSVRGGVGNDASGDGEGEAEHTDKDMDLWVRVAVSGACRFGVAGV